MNNSIDLRILMATHKPCMLPTEDLYFPIHCGRSVTQLDDESLDWMKKHTHGDDTGDNISKLNPYFCELTAVYWAWKNYEKLGNPEKIGLCHYRRYFMDMGSSDEIVVPVHYLNKTVADQFSANHNPNNLRKAIDLLPDPELKNSAIEYLNQRKGYFFNMFILQRKYFFDYCNIIFPLLFKLSQNSNWDRLSNYQRRMPGFIAERITGAYLYHLGKKNDIPLHETLPIVPIGHSYNELKRQISFTAHLAKIVPKFPYFYSKFLSVQTHFLKH